MDKIRQYRFEIVLGLFSITCIAASLFLLYRTIQNPETIEFFLSDSAVLTGDSKESQSIIYIDVSGAVNKSGIYRLPKGSRVEDVLGLAGGFRSDVDNFFVDKYINRARVLVDGEKIYIPIVGDESYNNLGSNISGSITSHNSNQKILGETGRKISINTSSLDEIESLSGIGPVTAKNIISNRPYGTLEELISKKAMGKALFEKLKNQLSL